MIASNFHMSSPLSPGSPIFLQQGAYVFNQLVSLLRKHYKIRGYQEIITPNMWKNELWMQSGHFENYKENMFLIENKEGLEVEKDQPQGSKDRPREGLKAEHARPQEGLKAEQAKQAEHRIRNQFASKSMNCPGHTQVFKRQQRLEWQLPLRFAEFGTLHRNELEGALNGLFRVRKFTQDDAHIFCTLDQIGQEISAFLEFLDEIYGLFGFEYTCELSTRPKEKSIGTDEMWQKAETFLQKALEKSGKPFQINEGDGAFYGPKIDIHMLDKLNRSHQCGTIQLDFNLPERFDLRYYKLNSDWERPVMLHRAIFGSLERFIGILLDQSDRLPFWLSQKQFKICSLYKQSASESFELVNEYAASLQKQILEHDWRIHVDLDISSTHIKQKIKSAIDQGYHYLLIVGPKEMVNSTIAIRTGNKNEYGKRVRDVVEIFQSNMPQF